MVEQQGLHPDDLEPYHVPDHQEGAVTNCECSDCREKRLADDRHRMYTPHDMADAWSRGWHSGFEKGAAFGRRVP